MKKAISKYSNDFKDHPDVIKEPLPIILDSVIVKPGSDSWYELEKLIPAVVIGVVVVSVFIVLPRFLYHRN